MNYNITNQNADQIIKWIKDGKSIYWISKKLGCAKTSVNGFLKKRGIKSKHKCKVNYDDLLKDHEQEVVDLYNSGKTEIEIGQKLGFAGASIHRILKSTNLSVRDYRYYVNEHFFDKVDSEEVAYVLGWFYSDGCVDNAGKMRIQIQKDDEKILYKIRELMEYNGPFYEVPPPKKYPHRKAQVTLCINRKVLTDKLIALGCIPNKSLNLDFPTFISDDMLPHFIRGVFDGDGSISCKKNSLNISITSCEYFIQPLRDYLLNTLNIHTKHYYRAYYYRKFKII